MGILPNDLHDHIHQVVGHDDFQPDLLDTKDFRLVG